MFLPCLYAQGSQEIKLSTFFQLLRGKKTIDIKIIPEKKESENKKFLIIFRQLYIISIIFCLFEITLTFDFLINILGAAHTGYIKRISSSVEALSTTIIS